MARLANRLYLVTLQKQVPGKSHPTPAQALRYRRVVVFLAPSAEVAARGAVAMLPEKLPVVNVAELLNGAFVVVP